MTVSTAGYGATGIYAIDDGNSGASDVHLVAPVNVTTTGNDAEGVVASGTTATVGIAGGTITTRGEYSVGISARGGGAIWLGIDKTSDATTGSHTTVNTEKYDSHGLSASGSGSVIQGNLVDVTTLGDNSIGSQAIGGAQVLLKDSSSNTSGDQSHGMNANGTDSYINGTNMDIQTTGDGSDGIRTAVAGQIVISGTAMTTGVGSHGIHSLDSGSKIIGNTVAISTTGDDSDGARAEAQGKIVLDSSSVSTDGGNSHGVIATDNSSLINARDTTIATTGVNSDGARAMASGQVLLLDGTIATDGDTSHGINSTGAGSFVDARGTEISTSGNNAIGVNAELGARVDLNGNTIDTIGQTAFGMQSSGVSSKITSNDVILTTTGAAANGIQATGGGQVLLTDGSINTGGDTSYGINSNGTNSLVDANGTAIATAGTDAIGINADLGGQVTLTGNTVDTTGQAAFGMQSSGNNSKVTGIDVITKTTGADSGGVQSMSGGQVLLTDGSITTTGNNAYGVLADGILSVVDINGSSIATSGAGAIGASANTGGQVILTGNTISTTGIDAHGLQGTGNDSKITGTNLTITTDRSDSEGARAIAGGQVLLNDGTITTKGDNSYGLNSDGAGSLIDANGTAIETSGIGAVGVNVIAGGQTALTGNAITTGGVDSHGLKIADTSSRISSTGLIITTTGGTSDGVRSTGGVAQLTDVSIQLSGIGSTGINAAGGNVAFAGQTQLEVAEGEKAIWSQNSSVVQGTGTMNILGDIVVDGIGSSSDLIGDAGSYWKGKAITSVGTNNLNFRDSLWDMTGSSKLSNLSLNNSTVAFDTTGDYKTLTVDTLAGSGTFVMRTDIAQGYANGAIGSGNLGVGGGDLIVVIQPNGASGDHILNINNQASAEVDSFYEHKVVQTSGGSENFTLAHDVEVGGYLYSLHKESDNNWYLGREREYELPTYTTTTSASINAFAGNYLIGYAEMNTLIQRLGDLRNGEGERNIWARGFGGKFESDSSFLRGFDMSYSGFQVGIDSKFDRKDKKGSYYVGAMAGYAKGNQDYSGYGDGSIDSKSIGLYGTYMTNNNTFYVDLVGKYNWLTNDYHVLDSAGDLVIGDKMHSDGFSISVEIGKRYHFNQTTKRGWYLEPQVQLSYSHMSGGRFDASNGLVVDVDGFESLLGRVGTLAGYEIKGGKNPINIYGKLSYLREFKGDLGFAMNGTGAQESFGDSWLVYGVGITAQLSTKHNLYFDIERIASGKFDQPWAINGGYRFCW